MTHPLVLHPDRLFPADSGVRAIARALYGHVRKLPIISPHGHTDPAWWFHDSSEGLRRFREQTTETAGFYNTVGFNDDTRAFLSIPARHDVARRIDCAFLARLVAEHPLSEDEAVETAVDLAYNLPKQAYRL
jgi:glucuronate isomerase